MTACKQECKYVNLLRTKENSEFKTQQSIEFRGNFISGCMSDDAQLWMKIQEKFKLENIYNLQLFISAF
ncbi:unnamed protein product [Paramecium primaurelia]|uniref:Uncharacterized protein n=1 Tax=Paramecium primaurelia TaxID=5886 RepID=A0A8S1QEW0_PARPR|nr:unnamed protein product [Paramecium primaurelia]